MSGWDHCRIFDNGSDDGTWEYLQELPPAKFTVMLAKDLGIYDMWDLGLKYSDSSDHVLFLNNDVTLHRGTIEELNKVLKIRDDYWLSYPDYNAKTFRRPGYRVTHGTYRHGGMSGFCFMIKRNKITWSPLVDPQFVWWGGDDDIAFNIEKHGGKQVRVVGLPVTHLMEGTARHYSLGKQKAADLAAVKRKWGK